LIDLVAEDNAIEDTIYHLARALDAERIDLNTFLKVRVCCHGHRAVYFDADRQIPYCSKHVTWQGNSIRSER